MKYKDWKDKWERVVDKACNDYASLSKEERMWFNIRGLIDSVDNGGIISFYYNSGADYMDETIEDLNYIGAKDVIKLIEKINRLFPDGKPSNDMDQRNAVINSWEDGKHENLFEKVDNKFYELEEKLEKKLEPQVVKLLEV